VPIFKCKNISLLIVTNKNAIQLENNDRKWFVLDISNEKCQNIQYFDKLLKVMNSKNIVEAFFWNYIEIAKLSIFNEHIKPTTTAKRNLILENLHSIFEFIKEKYILKNIGINEKFSTFYEKYEFYCDRKN
jgi:hypothetical protein